MKVKSNFYPQLLLLFITVAFSVSSFSQTVIVPFGAAWRYLDNGTNQGTAWRTTSFNDAAWASGNAELGYGEGDEATIVSFGPNANAKYITTYFRKTFSITGIQQYAHFMFSLYRDDGAIIYINGHRVYATNIAEEAGYRDLADDALDDGLAAQVFNLSRCNSFLVEGTNTIAVEVHQSKITSSDLSFKLQVIGNPFINGIPALTRSPYLQMGRQTAITIRWRTDIACTGRVELGTAFGTYTAAIADEACATTEHEVTVAGLTPGTKYFYRIGTNASVVLQAATNNFFTTLPPDNTTRKLRFAVFGDCGRNDNGFQTGTLTQYQRYLSDNGIDAADALLLLGDNAYNSGTEEEYTANFFTPFGTSILRNHKMYPAPGNHDYGNISSTSKSVAYYRNFTMPANGEIGGVPSGTEAFYSYNIGDVHFLSMDSYGEEAGNTRLYDTLGKQAIWVKADLAANTKKWVVAYWHHPPYTKGSHDSDTETDLRNMRENFIRILERNGVDLILCGHSHDYERSYLLRGYYKKNPADMVLNGVDFNVNKHAVNNSTGKYDGSANSCTYTTTSGKVHHGTVYVVSGSAGANGSVVTSGPDTWPHNAMPFSIDEGGMFYFEVENNRLDAIFINRVAGPGGAAAIGDRFTIMKDVAVTNSYTVTNGNAITLTASWPQAANYIWTNIAGISRTVSITPPVNTTTVYTVSDGLGCVKDQFSVTASGTLPVSLVSFDARLINEKVQLTWVTAMESNNDFFTIERSVNGIDYTAIGIADGAGNSTVVTSYLFTDAAPAPGISYYRLSQHNYDNRKEYLGIKRIENISSRDFDVKALSGFSGKLVLQINTSGSGWYHFSVYDMVGRKMKDGSLNLQTGILRKEVILTPGIYIWKVRNEKGDEVRQKTVIK
jgi:acid phosphatase type 7